MPDNIINETNLLLIIGAVLLLLSIFGSKVSVRLGFPTLIIFIVIGIITRKIVDTSTSELNVDQLKPIAKLLGVITLTFILFSGGLETDKNHVYPIRNSGLLLSTLGVLCTAVIVGCFLYICHYGDEKWCFSIGLLVGAIISSTDAAAVFSILRSRKINLKANIGPLLELESGSNDVMVYFLMTFLLSLQVNPNTSIWWALPQFLKEMGIGAVGGYATGLAMLFVLNKINLPHKSLYPILTLGMIFLPYGLVNMLHGSGYLAVYIAGITLGSRDFICRRSIIKFYEGFGWLLQIGMFITLGLLVDLSTLVKVIPLGLALSLVLMLLARPLSVFISLLRSPFTNKQKLFISWVGLRGAVPIVFATYLYAEKGGLPDHTLANELFHLIFFIVLISVLVQGSTLYPLAKKLDLEDKTIKKKHKKHVLQINDQVKKMLISLEIPAGSPADNKLLVDLGLPKESLIVLVCRDNSYFPARGNTLLKAYDKVFVVIDTKKEKKAIEACLGIVS